MAAGDGAAAAAEAAMEAAGAAAAPAARKRPAEAAEARAGMELPACKRPRAGAEGDERPAEAMAYWLPPRGDVAEEAAAAATRWPAFCGYCRAQRLCSEEALERGFAAMTRPVPLSFRLNLASPRGREALAALQRLIGDRLEPVAWMPEQSGWRVVPGGSRSGEEEARALVVRAMNRGDFQLQDSSSMLPPLALGVEEHHLVLDMCAAPGSKTLQVLDAMLHKAAGLSPPSSLPSGGVVANDTHKDRASKIRQRARFCRRASAALLVTQVDARRFPALHLRSPQGTYPKVKFDRIVCDVPCSADGQLRKYNHDWDVRESLQVHHVQLELLRRGLELLKPGGQLCYSTCSVNPIEDEAVVAAALAGSSGAVRLVPMPSHLDGVDWQPGVKTWRVPHDGGLVDSFEGQDGLSESMFPPRIPVEGLELTRRVLPGDGAGFFLALLEKPAREERVPAAAVDDARQDGEPKHDRAGQRQGRPLFERTKECDEAAAFFGLAGAAEAQRLVTLTFQKERGRTVSMVSTALSRLQDHRQLHCINGGMPVASRPRRDNSGRGLPQGQAPWHPCPEAAEMLAKVASSRVVELAEEGCRRLLEAPGLTLGAERLQELGARYRGGATGSGAVVFGHGECWDVGSLGQSGDLSVFAAGNLRNTREKLLPYGDELNGMGVGCAREPERPRAPLDVAEERAEALLAAVREGSEEEARAAALEALRAVDFPEDQGRGNIRPSADAKLPGFTIGATNLPVSMGDGVQLTSHTRRRPWLCRILAAFAARFVPDHEFASVQVNKNSAMRLHVDNYDLGRQALVTLGDFTGGGLYVYGEGVVNLRRWHTMDGRSPHQVLPWRGGDRYSLVYFAPCNYRNATPEDTEALRAAGFRLPAGGGRAGRAAAEPLGAQLGQVEEDMRKRGVDVEACCDGAFPPERAPAAA